MLASWRARWRHGVALGLGAVVALSASSARAEAEPAQPETPAEAKAPADGVRYRAEIRGVQEKKLAGLLESSSQLLALKDQRPPSLVALERRARGDIERLRSVLRSEGYYDASIDYQLLPDEKPVRVTLEVAPGERYRLLAWAVRYSGPGADDPGLPREAGDVDLVLGEPARAEGVVDARRRLLALLGDRGHPLARVEDERVTVDHADRGMSVDLEIVAGEEAAFGAVAVVGTSRVEPGYVEDFVGWREGERFERAKLDATRSELLETGLFDSVAMEWPNELDDEGRLPVTLRVEERKHRSIGLAGRWSTDEGFSVEVEWENRNLFGRGERLSLEGEGGEIKQEASASFRKPRLLRPDQDLLLRGALAHEDTDAYDGPITDSFAGLERRLGDHWSVVGGVAAEWSNLSDLQGTRRFSLVGLEARAERDTSNDRLDPSSGTRLRISLRPYHGTGEHHQLGFLTGGLSLAGYRALDDGGRFVIAGRSRFGSTVGGTSESLPANKRFYAGGGASVRGYRFQSVGPLAFDETPLGGRSLLEVSTELRTRITRSIGVVAFVDGGNVWDDELPDLSTNFRWSAGVGGRYFTTFGPIRVDFGFPLNGRDHIDDLFQFYISIGQAF